MKEKIRKILFRIVEIAAVTWAIIGMISNYRSVSGFGFGISTEYHIVPVLVYFLSAALILYLVRKYERKN